MTTFFVRDRFSMKRHLRPALTVLLGACLSTFSACTDDDGHHHEEDDAHLFCQGDEDVLTAGLTVPGDQGFFKVTLLDWAPDPLIVGNNSLTIAITDASDVPVDGITFDAAETWQRVHDHGTPIPAVITALANVGEFQIDDLNVVHTGSWLFRFRPTDGVNSDFAQFNFGIDCPPEHMD